MAERTRPAGGLGAIASTARVLARTNPWRAARALRRLNQEGGFNCPGCAWPEEAERRHIDWCENGVKHVAHEVTGRRIGAEFFAAWPIEKLLEQSDQWLESQGRLVEPLIRWRGSDRYEPIAWRRRSRGSPTRCALPRVAERGGLLHLRADEQRGGLPLPAAGPPVRHQQSPGLLEHVPRVERHWPLAGDRRRQGHGQPRRFRQGGCDLHHRSKPGNEPPAHVLDAARCEAARLQNRQRQPVEGALSRALRPSARSASAFRRGNRDLGSLPAADRRRRGASKAS